MNTDDIFSRNIMKDSLLKGTNTFSKNNIYLYFGTTLSNYTPTQSEIYIYIYVYLNYEHSIAPIWNLISLFVNYYIYKPNNFCSKIDFL